MPAGDHRREQRLLEVIVDELWLEHLALRRSSVLEFLEDLVFVKGLKCVATRAQHLQIATPRCCNPAI